MATTPSSVSILNAYCFLFLVLLSQVLHISTTPTSKVAKGCGFFIVPKFHLEIANYIGDIKLHCKSKDDDLGEHSLVLGQTYGFSFRPQAFGRTLFFCAVIWNGKVHWFDAYIHKRDYQRCVDAGCHCPWRLRPLGPCFTDNCTPWNEKIGAMWNSDAYGNGAIEDGSKLVHDNEVEHIKTLM